MLKNFKLSKAGLLALTLLMSNALYADVAINHQAFDKLLSQHVYLGSEDFEKTKAELWSKYLKDVQNVTVLKSEFDHRALKLNDKTMRFSLDVIGEKPEGGYPLYIALHGGGQTMPAMNDDQWQAMQFYYKESVKNGVYIAPRGITDNWKLHFEDESYPLYDKLIESAVLFADVNPDRVYLLGFSAGGDGVYQITPRMPERFAAANMSAGHHNWITFDNLHNTPFLLQVGELDSAYERNHVAAKNYIALNKLHEDYGSGFKHDVFIHYNATHNGWKDNDSRRRNQPIIADPVAWLQNGDRATTQLNTNAMDWMNQYTRDAAPLKLVWDLSVGAELRTYQTGADVLAHQGYSASSLAKPKTLFYWLDVSQSKSYPAKGKIIAEINKASNTIVISKVDNVAKFKILLNPAMMDFSKPVVIDVAGKVIGQVVLKQDVSIMARTMLERSDLNEIYDAEISLARSGSNWKIIA